jgi:transposase-like protein
MSGRIVPSHYRYRRPREDALPTPRTALRTRYVRVLVFCNSCRHQADADLGAIVAAGRGDMPLSELRFRCSQCGTDRTDFVVTSRDNPRPWWSRVPKC